jgi:hypothetical protein
VELLLVVLLPLLLCLPMFASALSQAASPTAAS